MEIATSKYKVPLSQHSTTKNTSNQGQNLKHILVNMAKTKIRLTELRKVVPSNLPASNRRLLHTLAGIVSVTKPPKKKTSKRWRMDKVPVGSGRFCTSTLYLEFTAGSAMTKTILSKKPRKLSTYRRQF